jgi:hypothetical protein
MFPRINHHPVICNRFNRILFSGPTTGGDGITSAQIRVIDFPFPALSVKETRFGRDQSDTRIIHVPSGNIVVSDPVYWDDPEYSMAGNVEPGYYQLSVFVFEIPGKVFSYYFGLFRKIHG